MLLSIQIIFSAEAEMDDAHGRLTYQPFKSWGDRLKEKIAVCPPAQKDLNSPLDGRALLPEKLIGPSIPEEQLFREAMQGVRPLSKKNDRAEKRPRSIPQRPFVATDEVDIRRYLDDLVKNGKGFILSQTPEYVEGTGRNIPLAFAQRLHQGDFSIQACLDLHGLSVAQARVTLEDFLHSCLVSGKGAGLIIHGRGMSSPKEPVLKNKVREWLTRSRWRKWVIAFASARSYDGGTGATYVLLRQGLLLKPKRSPQRAERRSAAKGQRI